VKLLLGKIDVNAPDDFARTPLLIAVAQGAFEVAQYLLGRPGISVNATARDVTFSLRKQLHSSLLRAPAGWIS
jgi:ankyrin repeat protein